jgi:ubiquinone/menaquinone biosynthesis C-methylase UbiE
VGFNPTSLDLARGTATSDFSMEEYQYWLGLQLEDLKGKFVLDIGCGNSVLISELQKFGVQAFGIDVRVKNNALFACALAQQLPFRDQSFDLVVSTACLPIYFTSAMQKSVLREIRRVMKPDASATFAPLTPRGTPVVAHFRIGDNHGNLKFEERNFLKAARKNKMFAKIENCDDAPDSSRRINITSN